MIIVNIFELIGIGIGLVALIVLGATVLIDKRQRAKRKNSMKKLTALLVSIALFTGCATGPMETLGYGGNPITHGLNSEKIAAITDIVTLALIVRGYTPVEAADQVNGFILKYTDALIRVRSLTALSTLIRHLIAAEYDEPTPDMEPL